VSRLFFAAAWCCATRPRLGGSVLLAAELSKPVADKTLKRLLIKSVRCETLFKARQRFPFDRRGGRHLNFEASKDPHWQGTPGDTMLLPLAGSEYRHRYMEPSQAVGSLQANSLFQLRGGVVLIHPRDPRIQQYLGK
jgi:hypothetical protein